MTPALHQGVVTIGMRWIVLLLAVAQILAGRLHEILGWGRSIADRSAALDTVLTPAGYAFSIWGVIYLGCLLLAVHQARPSQQNRRDLDQLRPFLAGALLGNALWPIYVQGFGLGAISVILIFATLASLLSGWYRWELAVRDESIGDDRMVRLPLSLFAGWVSAAAFVNLAATSKYYQVSGGFGEVGLGCLLLVGCGVVALTVCRQLAPARPYAAAVLWALVGILASGPPLWIGLTAALVGLAVLVASAAPARGLERRS